MADEVKAIRTYTPRVKLGKMVELQELVSFIMGRTSFNEGAVLNMLMEFRDAVTFFNMSGRPLRLQGLGIFAPRINNNGKVGMSFKMDKNLKSEMNVPGKFKGDIVNKDMMGKSMEEMVAQWNQDHPQDQIKIKKK